MGGGARGDREADPEAVAASRRGKTDWECWEVGLLTPADG